MAKATKPAEPKSGVQKIEPIIIKGAGTVPPAEEKAHVNFFEVESKTLEETLITLADSSKTGDWVNANHILAAKLGRKIHDRNALKLLRNDLQDIAAKGTVEIFSTYRSLGLPYQAEGGATQYKNLSNVNIVVRQIKK